MHLRLAIVSFPLLLAQFAAQAGEPTVALPESAVVFPGGNRVVLNGVPMRMTGFGSRESVRSLLTWFTTKLGKPLTIDTVGRSMILGKADGDYHVTVRMEPSGSGVQGVVAIANLKAASEQGIAYREQLARWLLAWPAGTRVLSDMTSEDQGLSSRHVVLRNFQTQTINSSRVTAILARDGYLLEQEVVADEAAGSTLHSSREARTLYFKGEGKEAMATISRDKQGSTVTVLNTISSPGAFK